MNLTFYQIFGLRKLTAEQIVAGLRVLVNERPDLTSDGQVRGPFMLLNQDLQSKFSCHKLWSYIPDFTNHQVDTMSDDWFSTYEDINSEARCFIHRFCTNVKCGHTLAQAWNNAANTWPEVAKLAEGPVDVQFIDLEKLLVNCAELCEECADFCYDAGQEGTCSNVAGGDPRYVGVSGCLIGQALQRDGYQVTQREQQWSVRDFSARIRSKLSIEEQGRVLGFLSNLQVNQDCGDAWGECWDKSIADHPVEDILSKLQETS